MKLHLIRPAVASAVLLVSLVGTATAFDQRVFQFQLAGPLVAGPGRAQLQGESSGTIPTGQQDALVGDLMVQLVQNPLGCPLPDSIVHPAGTDSFYVFWPTNCMTLGDQVLLRFTTISGTGPLQISGAQWLDTGGGSVGAIWQEVANVPGLPLWAVPALALAMLLLAVLHIRRRRRTIRAA